MKRRSLRIIAVLLLCTLLGTTVAFGASIQSWKDATVTAGDTAWTNWCTRWKTIKSSPTQMSLTPGVDETELNFAWYSVTADDKPQIKIGKKSDLSDATLLEVTTATATEGFLSNKATATGLVANTTYYYNYTVQGQWTEATIYKTDNPESYQFAFVGDPQIGATKSKKASGSKEKLGQSGAVRNDSYNWNTTLEAAQEKAGDLSFVVTGGDQVQSTNSKSSAKNYITYNTNEIEYAGFLSPELLQNVPIATTIGNHDYQSANYSYHFNNPNMSSKYGVTYAGGDYSFTYGNALFIMLNTNNTEVEEHESFLKETIAANTDVTWKIVVMHQDIYGAGSHSAEKKVIALREGLTPVFQENGINLVLTGHDHSYAKSYVDGIWYVTANSASGSKFNTLLSDKPTYLEDYWQAYKTSYSLVTVTEESLSISTYCVETDALIDTPIEIKK